MTTTHISESTCVYKAQAPDGAADSVHRDGSEDLLLERAVESSAVADGVSDALQPVSFRFETTTTLESIRVMMAQFADEREWNEYHTPRNLVLALTGELGELCEIFQWKGDSLAVNDWNPDEKVHLGEELSDVLLYLVRLADKCNVDLPTAVHEKMVKNARKYPATKQLQRDPLHDGSVSSTLEGASSQDLQSRFEATTTLESIREKTAHFAEEREWSPNLTPRNLLLALTGEVGELCEIFQWKGDHMVVEDWPQEEKVHLGEELSDVLLYLVQLADRCTVDLPTAVKDKMVKNAKKYPANLVKGSSKKYNEYKQRKV